MPLSVFFFFNCSWRVHCTTVFVVPPFFFYSELKTGTTFRRSTPFAYRETPSSTSSDDSYVYDYMIEEQEAKLDTLVTEGFTNHTDLKPDTRLWNDCKAAPSGSDKCHVNSASEGVNPKLVNLDPQAIHDCQSTDK